MFELFKTDTSDGTLAEVWIDKEAKLCKKYFKPLAFTASGKISKYTNINEVKSMYENEIYWSTVLKSDYILELYEYGESKDSEGYYLIQEYVGPDLLSYYIESTLHETFPNIIDQLEGMFKLFKEHNIHKKNNALSNLTGSNGRIKAFDFKYASNRTPGTRLLEIHSIDMWLSKIDANIKTVLMPLI